MIRAKFRCMKTSRDWRGTQVAEFLPVNRSKDKDPENAQFWEATPSGEASLVFKGEMPYEPGDYYYIDMEPNPEGDWVMDNMTRHETCGQVYLRSGYASPDKGLLHGFLQMSLNYLEVYGKFGQPGGKWDVVFSFAEKSDGDA